MEWRRIGQAGEGTHRFSHRVLLCSNKQQHAPHKRTHERTHARTHLVDPGRLSCRTAPFSAFAHTYTHTHTHTRARQDIAAAATTDHRRTRANEGKRTKPGPVSPRRDGKAHSALRSPAFSEKNREASCCARVPCARDIDGGPG